MISKLRCRIKGTSDKQNVEEPFKGGKRGSERETSKEGEGQSAGEIFLIRAS